MRSTRGWDACVKVMIFGPVGLNAYHFETELELAQRHLDGGDEVTWVRCVGLLPACDWNRKHDLGACLVCTSIAHRGRSLLSRPVAIRSLPELSASDRAIVAATPRPQTLDDLRALTVGASSGDSFAAFDLGLGVLSSLVSLFRDPKPDVMRHQALVHDLLVASHGVYRSMLRLLETERPDRVYLFNGRFALQRAAMRACEARQVCFLTHERGRDYQHFELYENHLPHDPDRFYDRAIDAWTAADATARDAVARRYFEDRAAGLQQSWFSFTAEQRAGLLPPGFNPRQRNMAVFISSEDEFVAISDLWRHELYRDQQDGIERLAADLMQHKDIHLVVRVHPNLRGLDNTQTRGLRTLARWPNLTLVPAESEVSSYAIMRACEKTISFGSTMGIEAVFWGYPSIVLGPSFYRRFEGPCRPRSHEEALRLVVGSPPPGPPVGALQFAHHRATFGTPYRYFAPASLRGGPWAGTVIEPSRFARGISRGLSARASAPLRILARTTAREIARQLCAGAGR